MPQQDNPSGSNSTESGLSVFFLSGIPGLEDMHLWISIPFCSAFTVAIVGNCALLYVIKIENSLHQPMFYFLAMLATLDLFSSVNTMPKTLSIFWFKSKEISFTACLVQMFFLHTFTGLESAVLLAMAFDRFVAICNPLRYTTILTNSLIVKIGLVFLSRSFFLMLPLPVFLSRLPFCQSHVISHCYCEHMAVVKLACANTSFSNIYGIFVSLVILGGDLMFITLSYIKILRTVFSLVSKEQQMKALGTCVSHLCALLMFYTPMIVTRIIHRFGNEIAPHIHILTANFYLLFPPMMNPIVYGVKTKQIRDRMCHLFQFKKTYRLNTVCSLVLGNPLQSSHPFEI